MKYLFDTNVYVALLHDPRFFERHRAMLARLAPRLWLSAVVRFELLRGARGDLGRARASRATRSLEASGRVVAPTHADWARAGHVQGRIWDDRPDLRSKDLQNDILIATGARRVGATVITENTTDFDLIAPHLPHQHATLDDLAESRGP